MVRKIIKIDSEKCNGCSACAQACHEGAIEMINGKAVLTREDYCDGLGDCLPACPTGAITFEEREAPAYDHQAVMAAKAQKQASVCACPGSAARAFERKAEPIGVSFDNQSQLTHWPVQIKLAPVKSRVFDGAKLLIAADCTAYAYGNFHNDFIKGHKVVVGCPKLDMTDYSQKLCEIIKNNDVKSVTVVRMEVPCCGGIENAAKAAIMNSGKFIPWRIVTISTEGEILD